jgi:hypothetical protein
MKVPVRVRRLRWRGCDIEIINNRFYGFRFEWVITPLTGVAKKCLRRHNLKKMHDPTSHRDQYWCLARAKEAVNEISAPFWCAPWKFEY